MLAEAHGPLLLPVTLSLDEALAASATCSDARCAALSIKLVNFCATPQRAVVRLGGVPLGTALAPAARLVFLTRAHPEDENSLAEPFKVAPAERAVAVGSATSLEVELDAWSVNVLELRLARPAAA